MTQRHYTIPKLAGWLLNLVLPKADRKYLAGDNQEIYHDIAVEKGRGTANLWIAKQIIKFFPIYLFETIYWRMIMIKNYMTVAFRNLFKHKGYSFINIAGLALGMTCCLLILLWVFDELSFDRFHENADLLYKVEQDFFYSGEVYHVYPTPYPMGPGIKSEVPEIVEQTRYAGLGNVLLKYGEKAFFENGVKAVDPSFLQMFTYPLILGNPETVLDEPHSLIVSKEIADKYFGSEEPIGKIVTLNNQHAFTVMGVFENVPTNSYLQFDILVPFDFTEETGQYQDNWRANSIITLVQVQENASIPDINQKITKIRHRHVEESFQDAQSLREFNEGPMTQVMLIPLTDVHLRRHSGSGQTSGSMESVYIFTSIAFVVLLIACINFMNLATARSAGRAKEIGMRKVVGATKLNLIGQFYSESILLACLALVFALLLTALILPSFSTLAEKRFAVHDFFQLKFIVGMIAITLVTGILSGSYPALLLSAFQPVKVLKGTLRAGVKSGLFRKILVILQFGLSIFLIIGTGVVYDQLTYMQNMKLGYDKEHVIYIPLRGDSIKDYDVLKQALKRQANVLNVSGSWLWPAFIAADSGGAEWEGKDPELDLRVCFNVVDFDYIETMKIDMADGRAFSRTFASDTAGAFVINEVLQKIMGMESVVNERLNFWGVDGPIVGVMKNFHFKSLHSEIEPLAIAVNTNAIEYAIIRLMSGNISEGINTVQSVWERTVTDYPFEFHFLDESVESLYRNEKRTGTLLQIFAVLAILIACLGLFGLASFTAEQRTKEIGMRKVLGASVPSVVLLFSKEFTKWVVVSNLIAWPVAYFVLKGWLQGFAYRTSMAWWIFLGSGVLALLVALLTMSYQSIKTALTNPADSLRYE